MSNRKSYIGFALDSGVGKYGESDISLIPAASGYRDRKTQELIITDNYSKVIKAFTDGPDLIKSVRELRVAIPMSQIISVRIFYPHLYTGSH